MFAKRTNKHPYSPNLFITIARKLYGDCGIEHINDIKKNSAIYIFHGVRRDKKNPSDEKHVLVKVLLSADELSKTKFENEAFYYSQFNHDHLIKKEFSRKINFGYKLGKKNCIVLEYVDGVDLELVINSMAVTKEKIPEKTAIDIIIKTLSALNEVHHLKDKKENNLNIVHADISPHNILLSKTGQVKLIDFGISVIKEKQKKIKKDIIDGKISYMSPEQILGEPIDQRTDIFSIGIVLAEMLLTTKLNPTVISSDKVRENAINAHYPAINESSLDEALKKILAKALEKDPNNRYQDALLMIKALEDYKEKKGLVSRSQDIVAVVKTIFMYLSSGKTVVGEHSYDAGVKQALLNEQAEEEFSENEKNSFDKEKDKRKNVTRVFSWAAPVVLGVAVVVVLIMLVPHLRSDKAPVTDTKPEIKTETPLPFVKNEATKPKADNVPVNIVSAEKQNKEPWVPNIQITSPEATIYLSTDTDKWNGQGRLILKDKKIDDEIKEQKFSLKISKKGFATKYINFTLTPENKDYIKTITLQETKYGMLVAGADDIVSYTVAGQSNHKEIPYTFKLPQGKHKMKISGVDVFNNNKAYVLYHTVDIKPDKKTKCMAYVSEEKKFVVCE